MSESPFDLVVVGGGISGLVTARRVLAQQPSWKVAVLERETRPGGTMLSDRLHGCVSEWGPNGYLDNAPLTRDLVRELGLEDRSVVSGDRAKKRYLFVRGAMRPLPMAPPAFLSSDLLSLKGRLRALAEPMVRSRAREDETVRAFFARRFGTEVADILADALVAGVFGGDSNQLSLAAAFPPVAKMEAESGGVIKGMIALAKERKRRGEARKGSTPICSFDEGMEVLITALVKEMGDRMRSGVAVSSVVSDPAGFRVGNEAGPDLLTRRVVLAPPSYISSRLLQGEWAHLSGQLDAIEYAGIAVVGLVYPRNQVGHPLDGFGVLVPRGQGPRLIGCLWPGSIFESHAPEGHVLLRVMLGGARDPEAAMLADGKTVDLARKEVGRLLDVKGAPVAERLYRHPRGIPQYTVGHLDRISRLERDLAAVPGLYLTGNAYHGVGVNDCVRESTALAERIALSQDAPVDEPREQVAT